MRNVTKLMAILVTCSATLVGAEEWGNLTATFVYGGDAPTQDTLTATKDQEVCSKHKLLNESLIVDPETKGVANVVGYLYLKRGADAPVHESYKETAEGDVTLDNKDCRFEPHIATMRTTQKLVIGNKDPIGHNTKIDASKNPAINDIVPANGQTEKTFPEEERLPVRVSCSIHPWMEGWLLVKKNPYFAVSGADGSFELKNLPAGTWTFQFWHEAPGYVKEVSKDGKGETWKKGRVEVEIKPGDNALGNIELPASLFN